MSASELIASKCANVYPRFADRDLFMRYYGGAPGHQRRCSNPRARVPDYEIGGGDIEVTEAECVVAEANHSRLTEAEEWEEYEYESVSGSDDGDDDVLGDDERAYAKAGFSVPS